MGSVADVDALTLHGMTASQGMPGRLVAKTRMHPDIFAQSRMVGDQAHLPTSDDEFGSLGKRPCTLLQGSMLGGSSLS